MKASWCWFAVTTVCVVAALITGSVGWFLMLAFCLWRWDQAEIQEHLKDIKERLDK